MISKEPLPEDMEGLAAYIIGVGVPGCVDCHLEVEVIKTRPPRAGTDGEERDKEVGEVVSLVYNQEIALLPFAGFGGLALGAPFGPCGGGIASVAGEGRLGLGLNQRLHLFTPYRA